MKLVAAAPATKGPAEMFTGDLHSDVIVRGEPCGRTTTLGEDRERRLAPVGVAGTASGLLDTSLPNLDEMTETR